MYAVGAYIVSTQALTGMCNPNFVNFRVFKEEYADLSAGPGGVISGVEDLARHAIWNT